MTSSSLLLPLPAWAQWACSCLGGPALEARWQEVIRPLPAGITHLALHATLPGEFQAIAPGHAGWRFNEFAWLADGGLDRLCRAAAVAQMGCRAMQSRWADYCSKVRPA